MLIANLNKKQPSTVQSKKWPKSYRPGKTCFANTFPDISIWTHMQFYINGIMPFILLSNLENYVLLRNG